jgi:preprotein translocase subunit SecG
MNIVLGILTFILILVSLFLILVVLAQKSKSDGGLGAAMGGDVTEATFGADTGNVLSKATINAAIAFFALSTLLFLGNIYERKHAGDSGAALPSIAAPAAPLPSPGAPSATPGAAPVAAPPVTAPATAGAPASGEKKP